VRSLACPLQESDAVGELIYLKEFIEFPDSQLSQKNREGCVERFFHRK